MALNNPANPSIKEINEVGNNTESPSDEQMGRGFRNKELVESKHHNLFFRQLAKCLKFLKIEGFFNWDEDESYGKGAVIKFNQKLYVSLVNNNTSTPATNRDNWETLQSLQKGEMKIERIVNDDSLSKSTIYLKSKIGIIYDGSPFLTVDARNRGEVKYLDNCFIELENIGRPIFRITGWSNDDESNYIKIFSAGPRGATINGYSTGELLFMNNGITPFGYRLADGRNGTKDLRGKYMKAVAKEAGTEETALFRVNLGYRGEAKGIEGSTSQTRWGQYFNIHKMPQHRHSLTIAKSSGSATGVDGQKFWRCGDSTSNRQFYGSTGSAFEYQSSRIHSHSLENTVNISTTSENAFQPESYKVLVFQKV